MIRLPTCAQHACATTEGSPGCTRCQARHHSSSQANSTTSVAPAAPAGEGLGTAREAVAVSLGILRAITEVEDWRHGSWAAGGSPMDQLASAGVIPVLVRGGRMACCCELRAAEADGPRPAAPACRYARAGGRARDEARRRAQVGMLRDLRPIRNPRRPGPEQQGAGSAAAAAAAAAPSEQPPSDAGEAHAEAAAGSSSGGGGGGGGRVYCHEPPYPGYRADLVAVLANAAMDRSAVQQVRLLACWPGGGAPVMQPRSLAEAAGSLAGCWQPGGPPAPAQQRVLTLPPALAPQEILQLGGVELLLSQCQLDDDSPLTREWAMWAIRNLSISNPEVQERIKVGSRLLHLGHLLCWPPAARARRRQGRRPRPAAAPPTRAPAGGLRAGPGAADGGAQPGAGEAGLQGGPGQGQRQAQAREEGGGRGRARAPGSLRLLHMPTNG
jgi:hypothetical protein